MRVVYVYMYIYNYELGVCSGLAVECWTANQVVRGSNPARAEIWIKISVFSVPCTVVHPYFASGTTSKWIPEPVPRVEFTYSEEESVDQKGADTSLVKRKHERNPMTQEQKEDWKNTKTWKKGYEKKHGMPTGCVPRV